MHELCQEASKLFPSPNAIPAEKREQAVKVQLTILSQFELCQQIGQLQDIAGQSLASLEKLLPAFRQVVEHLQQPKA
jgi:hypothetical protein